MTYETHRNILFIAPTACESDSKPTIVVHADLLRCSEQASVRGHWSSASLKPGTCFSALPGMHDLRDPLAIKY